MGLISRYMVLGRVLADDELSTDRVTWRRADSVWELKPDALRPGAGGGEDSLRLEQARRWEDERRGFDRRATENPETEELYRNQRSGAERRARQVKEQVQQQLASYQVRKSVAPKPEYKPARVLLVVMVAITLGALMYLTPRGQLPIAVRCDAPPAPQVNWNNCALQGAQLEGRDMRAGKMRNTNFTGANLRGALLAASDLAYSNLSLANLSYANLERADLMGAALRNADLSSSNLQHANLSYSDLTGANLGGADISHAKLDHAIWFDGGLCGTGSLGRCLRSDSTVGVMSIDPVVPAEVQ
ncbi:MAG: pentapeptide repeat-containing protein [Gammaproteobacteria bacterium]|nr:pentapeptide repeat-containing protein [Gammaproteobacteria bacterium]